MKRINFGVILIAITAVFLALCLGYYLGANSSSDSIQVITQRSEDNAEASAALRSDTRAPLESTEDTEMPSSALTENTESIPSATAAFPMNINTASAEELALLPGIGEVLAGRIVAYREEHGAFVSIEELMDVKGIGEKRFEAIRDKITVEDNDENTGR